MALIVTVALAGCGGGSEEPTASGVATASSTAGDPAGQQTLLDAQQLTVLDQQVAYPEKTPARVTSVIVTLEPGQETGWHKHRVPQYAYVLEGTVTVEYDGGVTKEYPAGTALMEAQDIWHNGTNAGTDPVRILTVYMGAKGVKNTVERAS